MNSYINNPVTSNTQIEINFNSTIIRWTKVSQQLLPKQTLWCPQHQGPLKNRTLRRNESFEGSALRAVSRECHCHVVYHVTVGLDMGLSDCLVILHASRVETGTPIQSMHLKLRRNHYKYGVTIWKLFRCRFDLTY
jgi:hypothetical protein